MTHYFIQAGIGLAAGLLGGLLGIGGSTIIIPGMIFYLSMTAHGYTGQDQHLLQATAMICNVAIATSAAWTHWRAGVVSRQVVTRLIPSALTGIILGVMVSNSRLFARENGRYLAIGLVGFLVYTGIYNIWKMFHPAVDEKNHEPGVPLSTSRVIGVGLPMGFLAGLLGIGGGLLCVPAQQVLLRIPLRRAIGNSAATIMCIAVVGAIYKNLTLASHGVTVLDSLRLAVMLIPTAMAGSYLGGKLTHILPQKVLQIVFVLFIAAVAYKTLATALAT